MALQSLITYMRLLSVPGITGIAGIGESFFDYEYLREYEAQIGTAQNVV